MDALSAADAMLRRLAGDGIVPANRVAAVLAHPDDETLGLGGQLHRMPGITIVHVTDGAPRNLDDARRLGFDTAEAYALARRRELEAAMARAGIGADDLVGLGVPDQEAAPVVAVIARRLARLLDERRVEVVFTHAYEGGHPDHDATALAVRLAADLAGRKTGAPFAIVEMPFYRAADTGWLLQQFVPDPSCPELVLQLDAAQRERKAELVAAYRTQADVLRQFPIGIERFRAAPRYDFTQLPPVDALLYERERWGLTGTRWLELAQRARADVARDLEQEQA